MVQAAGGIVRCEQGFDFSTQVSIAMAFIFEEIAALSLIQRVRALEEGLYLFPPFPVNTAWVCRHLSLVIQQTWKSGTFSHP